MNRRKKLQAIRHRRQKRNKARIGGGETRLRLAVKRSNTSFYAQLIDDSKGHTLVSASSREVTGARRTKTEVARLVGKLLAERALGAGIKKAVLDRREYRYHGRVKAFAEGARAVGLIF